MADDSSKRRVTLTFDNGPTAGVTDTVLDVLASRNILATFFVVGTQLRRPGGRDLARRAHAEGHRIGHHSTTHSVLLGLAPDPYGAVDAEIAALAPALCEFDGPEKLYRPYAAGGVLNRSVLSDPAVRYLERQRYTCILWNSVPHDWDDPNGWVERALADVDAQSWTVTVLHDLDTGAMNHLARFIDELDARGVEVVQDYPDSCVPMRDGRICRPLSDLLPLSAATT
jgi:peptidoglycan/xylan/chitin deacetylase (PgdA/CDA1 family)